MDLNPNDPPAPYRRLTLLDLIGIVAACAVGLGGWFYHARDWAALTGERLALPGNLHEWTNLGSDLAFGLAWLVVLRGLAVSPPRPLTCGAVACLAVLLATGFSSVSGFTQEYHEWRVHDLGSGFRHALITYVTSCWDVAEMSGAIVPGWLIQAQLIGWRRATGGLDRLGRGVGCWFLLAFLARTVVDLVRMAGEIRTFDP